MLRLLRSILGECRLLRGRSTDRVAGVVGQERYQFDIWGDTVNVAARMSEKSIPGSVAVTKDVWEHVGQDFNGEALGEMEIKGKGMISIFGMRPQTILRIRSA
jgi:class 3 adenylate cyclase